MRLVLFRHGETAHNRGQITLGRADVPLNARGAAQARAIAASFLRPPDAIISSSLQRALVTAQAIGSATGVPVEVDDALIEMDVGEMEHLTGTELRSSYPDFLKAWMSDEAADARMPGGETLREVYDRAWRPIERALAAHADGEVVVVAHNFVILAIVCRALSLPLAQFRRVRQVVAGRTQIDVDARGCTLVQLNDISHLMARGLAPEISAGRRR